jgi:hypothetical protein
MSRLLDNNNFLFRDITAVDAPGGMTLLRQGRYLHPAILSTIYTIFIKGTRAGSSSNLSILRYAGPSHRTRVTVDELGSAIVAPDADPSDDDKDDSDPWWQGLQGPNTNKRIFDEIPRTALRLVAACIRWVLRQHSVLGELPKDLPNMAINDEFAREIEMLIAMSMAGLDMAMITRAVKACGDQGAAEPRNDRDNPWEMAEVLSD